MKVQSISFAKAQGVAFKSIRTDKKAIEQLKTGEKPIIENNRQNIFAALNNLGSVHDRTSISFLLDIAENLNYGQGENSEFKKALDKDGITPKERENVNWGKMLSDTINKSLSGASEDVSDLRAKYEEIFNSPKALTPEQERILELRQQITDKICSKDVLEDAEKLEKVTNIRQNLDYFVASSEIPSAQKQDCMEKFLYLLSDDYKINPQLSDKKLQVLDEILNDVTVKTPSNDILLTKTTDQRSSGICASVSICRKYLAYEDKSRYVDLVLEELKDSQMMSVYDVTDLDNGSKVDIPKINIDYNSAMKQGFRITDASAHIWMNAAHASGDGSIQSEHYIAFDPYTYGIFNDASWYTGLKSDQPAKKLLLMSLIKENEALSSVSKIKGFMKNASEEIRKLKSAAVEGQAAAYAQAENVFSSVFPEKSQKEVRTLTDSLISFYTGKQDDGKVNVFSKFPDDTKNDLIAGFIEKEVPDMSDEQKTQVKEKAGVLRTMIEEYGSFDTRLKDLKKYNTPSGKFLYNKRLFNVAAAHRMAVETEVNLPDGVSKYEKKAGLPPRRFQLADYMNKLSDSLSSPAVRSLFARKDGTAPDEKKLRRQLKNDMVALNADIPVKVDSVVKKLTGNDLNETMAQMFDAFAKCVKEGDNDLMSDAASIAGIKPEKNVVLKHFAHMSSRLRNEPSAKEKAEAVRMLGYEDEYQLSDVILNSFYKSVQNGISEETAEYLAHTFGGVEKIEDGINSELDNYNKAVKKYDRILAKWKVPSSRSLILQKMEKDGFILSTSKLDNLYQKFSDIDEQRAKNESIEDLKERKNADEKAFSSFTPEEEELFAKIDKSVSAVKKYAKVTYQNLNKELSAELDAQYSALGMLNGQFWVREEGSSGLNSNEQIRIIEQMTGKPYHIESDVKNAVRYIKKGDGSGIINMSVEDDDYAYHAQYTPGITSETAIDSATGEKSQKDILWTDNSWGKFEKEAYWDGRDGFVHTDYNRGMGWKNGFIVGSDYKIGLPVDELTSAVGVHKEDGDKFQLVSDFILPGTPQDTYQKLYKVFNNIFEIDSFDDYYKALEQNLTSANPTQNGEIDVNRLSKLDEVVAYKTEQLFKRAEKEIKSEKDYDNLPDDDELRFIFEKMAAYNSTSNPQLREDVLYAENFEELQEANDEIFDNHMSSFGSVIAKTTDTINTIVLLSQTEYNNLTDELDEKFSLKLSDEQKNDILNDIFYDEETLKTATGRLDDMEKMLTDRVDVVISQYAADEKAAQYFADKMKTIISSTIDKHVRVNSLNDDSLKVYPYYKEFLETVDRFYNPKDDEEMLQIIRKLQNSTYEEVQEFSDSITEEDLGLNVRKPYEYAEKLLSGDSAAYRTFSDIIANDVLNREIESQAGEHELSNEELYRSVYVKLSELDVQKYIKSFKAEAFQKYKLRLAFPQPVVLSDAHLDETSSTLLDVIQQSTKDIQFNKASIALFNVIEKIDKGYKNSALMKDIVDGKNIAVTDENKDDISKLHDLIKSLSEKTEGVTDMTEIKREIDVISEALNPQETSISGKTIAAGFDNLRDFAAQFDNTVFNKSMFVRANKEMINILNENIRAAAFANIEPKYRDEAIARMNEIADLYRKNAPQAKIDAAENDFQIFFADKHIVKNPPQLLNECVALLQQGKADTDVYRALRSYLLQALKVAQQTKIQYKLVQSEHRGISSKTKEMLPLFSVAMSDGTHKDMDSDTGILYLVRQLNNPEDNHQTLNLFLNQTGLSKRALNAVIDNFKVAEVTKNIDKDVEYIKNSISQINNLADAIDEFIQKSDIKYSSTEDCIKQVNDYIERKFGAREASSVYSAYIEYMNSISIDPSFFKNTDDIAVFNMIKTKALQNITEININLKFQMMEEFYESLKDRVNLAYSINVPEDSPEFKNREKFAKGIVAVKEHINSRLSDVKEIIASSRFVNIDE